MRSAPSGRRAAVTLVEIMVASGLALALIGWATSLLLSSSRASRQQLDVSSQLEQASALVAQLREDLAAASVPGRRRAESGAIELAPGWDSGVLLSTRGFCGACSTYHGSRHKYV